MGERALIGFRNAADEPYRTTYVHWFNPLMSGALMVARLIALYDRNVDALRDEMLATTWSAYPENPHREAGGDVCHGLEGMREAQSDTDWLVTWDAGTVTFWQTKPFGDDPPLPWLTMDTAALSIVHASDVVECQRGIEFLENVFGYIDGRVMERIWDGWEDAFKAARSNVRTARTTLLAEAD